MLVEFSHGWIDAARIYCVGIFSRVSKDEPVAFLDCGEVNVVISRSDIPQLTEGFPRLVDTDNNEFWINQSFISAIEREPNCFRILLQGGDYYRVFSIDSLLSANLLSPKDLA